MIEEPNLPHWAIRCDKCGQILYEINWHTHSFGSVIGVVMTLLKQINNHYRKKHDDDNNNKKIFTLLGEDGKPYPGGNQR